MERVLSQLEADRSRPAEDHQHNSHRSLGGCDLSHFLLKLINQTAIILLTKTIMLNIPCRKTSSMPNKDAINCNFIIILKAGHLTSQISATLLSQRNVIRNKPLQDKVFLKQF